MRISGLLSWATQVEEIATPSAPGRGAVRGALARDTGSQLFVCLDALDNKYTALGTLVSGAEASALAPALLPAESDTPTTTAFQPQPNHLPPRLPPHPPFPPIPHLQVTSGAA
jgi:hypothetical protein